eukprot:gene880-178_t
MATSLPTIPAFEVHIDNNAGPRWEKWLSRFQRPLMAMKITDDTQKRAMLLHYAGPDVDEIFDTLPDTGEDKDYKKAVEKLNQYFQAQLSKQCQFPDADKELKEQIILNCTSNTLRKKALREDLDLTNLLKAGRALELSESKAKEVEHEQPERINQRDKFKRKGKAYNSCGNHRSKPPQKQNVRAVTQGQENVTENKGEVEGYLFTIRDPKEGKRSPMCEIDIDETKVKVMNDSGSTVNVIDEATFEKINNASRNHLQPTNHRIYAYGNKTPLPLAGTFEATFKSNNRIKVNSVVHVVSGNYDNLLGLDNALELGLLQLVNQTVSMKNPETCISDEHQKMRTTLPDVTPIRDASQKVDSMRERDSERKRKMKEYADKRRRAIESAIKPGETVLAKQPNTSKLSTPYSPKHMVVEDVKGSMVTASIDEKTITRNSSHFKAINSEAVPTTAKGDSHELLDH